MVRAQATLSTKVGGSSRPGLQAYIVSLILRLLRLPISTMSPKQNENPGSEAGVRCRYLALAVLPPLSNRLCWSPRQADSCCGFSRQRQHSTQPESVNNYFAIKDGSAVPSALDIRKGRKRPPHSCKCMDFRNPPRAMCRSASRRLPGLLVGYQDRTCFPSASQPMAHHGCALLKLLKYHDMCCCDLRCRYQALGETQRPLRWRAGIIRIALDHPWPADGVGVKYYLGPISDILAHYTAAIPKFWRGAALKNFAHWPDMACPILAATGLQNP